MRRYRFNVYRGDIQVDFEEHTLYTFNEAYRRARQIINYYNQTVTVEIIDAVTNEFIDKVVP